METDSGSALLDSAEQETDSTIRTYPARKAIELRQKKKKKLASKQAGKQASKQASNQAGKPVLIRVVRYQSSQRVMRTRSPALACPPRCAAAYCAGRGADS